MRGVDELVLGAGLRFPPELLLQIAVEKFVNRDGKKGKQQIVCDLRCARLDCQALRTG